VDNDKSLGFPKGRAEREDSSALCTALREWTEETGLLTIHLQMETEPVVQSGPHGDVHYFTGWRDQCVEPSAWKVQDDPHDLAPVSHAFWLPLREVSQLQRFPKYRLELLRKALDKLNVSASIHLA
jgi:8-oxo-dGTP pyrophosphatase MutT (NUDIX family)